MLIATEMKINIKQKKTPAIKLITVEVRKPLTLKATVKLNYLINAYLKLRITYLPKIWKVAHVP